jgi:hypothetical protein
VGLERSGDGRTAETFTLDEGVRLAGFLVEMTILTQTFIAGLRGAGGPVHLAAVTREGLSWVQRPEAGEGKIQRREILDAPAGVTSAPPDGIGAGELHHAAVTSATLSPCSSAVSRQRSSSAVLRSSPL